ncbi:hypothetical protein LZ31DRAFT_551891, partial [Colletotrichum somersetense]
MSSLTLAQAKKMQREQRQRQRRRRRRQVRVYLARTGGCATVLSPPPICTLPYPP